MTQKNVFDKKFSFIKLVSSFILHLIASLTIGPLITVFLFILWIIAMGQGGLFANAISGESLVGYWFVIITLLIFGLVWLSFFNNRKDSSLSSIKCYTWWSEYWNYLKHESKEMIDLPEEAENHFEVRVTEMDKKLPWLLGLLIMAIMGLIMSIIVYTTKDTIRKNLPSDLFFTDNQWLIGFSFFLLVALISIIVTFYLIYRYFYKINISHYFWRRFWLGLVLYSIKKSQSEFGDKIKGNDTISSYITGFQEKYNAIAVEIDASLENSNISLEQKVWLERKLEELEKTPGFLIPKSLSTISTFYGFALLIAGSFGNLIVGPATEILNRLAGLFI